jgi:arylsulfatase A-like enzyme
MCAFFAHAQSPVVNWKIPAPERFPRYKTDGAVPEYKGEPLPNIMIFLVDDMGVMDTSVPMLTDGKGNPKRYPLNDFYRTPSMERFAKQGIRFETFYAQNTCSPSRISILTGQNASRHRTTSWIKPQERNTGPYEPPEWNWDGIAEETSILPRELKAKGYRTIHVGKSHLGPIGSHAENPLNLGYDVNVAGNAWGAPRSYLGEDHYGWLPKPRPNAMIGLENYHGTDTFLTEALTLEAAKEVKLCAEANHPFYLNFSHYALHGPFFLDKRFAENYADEKDENTRMFATLVEGMDKSLGDMLDCFEELEIAENTLIIFLGDNGSDARPPVGEGEDLRTIVKTAEPLRGKKSTEYEGGSRVPFIAGWAKPNPENRWQKKLPIAAGKIQAQLGTINDLYPTIMELLDIPIPADHIIDGYSLKKRLAGEADPSAPEEFLMHNPHRHRRHYTTTFRDGDWKVIHYYAPEMNRKTAQYELFNLKEDLSESKDLSAAYPEKLSALVKKMNAELAADHALYPVKDGKPLKPVIP